MPKMTGVTILMLIAMLTNSVSVKAQEPGAAVVWSWDAIRALLPKDELTITLKDGSRKKGKLTGVTDTALTLSQGKNLAEINRETIFQIYHAVPRSRGLGTGIGAAVGAGIGVAGLTNDRGSEGVSAGAAIVAVVVLAGIGALIGRGIARSQKRALIYEARR
jgi:hypothetical protein